MRNYLLRRSYASEAIRTIDTTPCDQYPRAKQLSRTLLDVNTNNTTVEQKRLSLAQNLDSIYQQKKSGKAISPQDVAELWKKHKALFGQPSATNQPSTDYYEKFIHLLERNALNTQKSTSWARIRDLFEECNQLTESPTIPIFQSAITAYGKSGQLDKCVELMEQVKKLSNVSREAYVEACHRLFEVYAREGKHRLALNILQEIRNELPNEKIVKAVEIMADAAARRHNTEMLFQTIETTGTSLISPNKHVARKVVDSTWKGQWLAITDMMCKGKKERDNMMAMLRRLNVTKSQDFSVICQHIVVQALRSLEQSARKSMRLDPSSKDVQLMPSHFAQLFTVPRVAAFVELALRAFPNLRPPSQCLHDLLHLFAISGDVEAADQLSALLRKRKLIPFDKETTNLTSALEVSHTAWNSLSPSNDNSTSVTSTSEKVQRHGTQIDRMLNDAHSQQLAKALMHDYLANKQWDECLAMYGKMKALNQDFAYRSDFGLLECAVIAYAAQKEWDACTLSLRQAYAHENNHISSDWLKGLLSRMVYLYSHDRKHLSGGRIVKVMQSVEQICNIQLDIHYTNALIRRLGEERDLQAARQLYMWVVYPPRKSQESASARMVNRSTFHAIMNAAVHNNDVDLTIRAYHDLLHRWRPKLPLDKSESAMEAHQTQINNRLEPTLITYNILLNAYASRPPSPNFSQVYNLYRRMLVRQIEPDEVTYGTLAKAFSKTDDQDLVRSVLQGGSKSSTQK